MLKEDRVDRALKGPKSAARGAGDATGYRGLWTLSTVDLAVYLRVTAGPWVPKEGLEQTWIS